MRVFRPPGALAACAGELAGSLQTYITPDAFTVDLSVLFFIAILIGGRGSIPCPILGTIILTILPEILSSPAAWSTFLFALLLLFIVLLFPGGLAPLLAFRTPPPLAPTPPLLPPPST